MLLGWGNNPDRQLKGVQKSADAHNQSVLANNVLREILPYISAKIAGKKATHYRDIWSGKLCEVDVVRSKSKRNKNKIPEDVGL
jgi:hypothetical protein